MNVAAMECRPLAGGEAERYYLESLNVCFPGWGGRNMFDWCFSRESAGLRPDLVMVHDDTCRAVSGTANTYRRVGLPNGQTIIAGIMTGSWTLPEARGQGLFTRLINESLDLASARQASLLLGFYARTNPSAGRLRAAGSALFPSWHIRSPAERQIATDAEARARACVENDTTADGLEAKPNPGRLNFAPSAASTAIMSRRDGAPDDHQDVADAVHLVYTPDEWRDQFVRRPNPVTRVRSADQWSALVERTASFDRVLSLTLSASPEQDDAAWADAIAVLDARAAAAGRRVFVYTTDERQASAARDRGFEIVDGYVSALVSNGASLRAAFAPGAGGNGDALPLAPASSESQALADPASPWYLGRWSVRNGDRM